MLSTAASVAIGHSPEGMADAYVLSKGHKQQPISTTRASIAIRGLAPDCSLSDLELANVIAESALNYGLAVHFDAGEAIIEQKNP